MEGEREKQKKRIDKGRTREMGRAREKEKDGVRGTGR